MRGSLRIIFTILVWGNLILIGQYILAQAESDQDSPRAMIQRLELEIQQMQDKIAEDPSSPEAEKLRQKIQWSKRRIEEMLPGEAGRIKEKAREGTTRVSGLEWYMVIAKKNLFTPLGSGGEAKRQEFVLTGILGKMALIQMVGRPSSYYVSEGETFADGAKLVGIEEDSVTIVHEGNEIELKLGEGSGAAQSREAKGGGSGKSPREGGREQMEIDARRAEEMRMEEERHRREQEEREHIEREIQDLHRERDEIKQKIMEMEERGHVDHDAYRRVEEIDHHIRDLESELR